MCGQMAWMEGCYLMFWRMTAVVNEHIDLWDFGKEALPEASVALIANKD